MISESDIISESEVISESDIISESEVDFGAYFQSRMENKLVAEGKFSYNTY